MAADYLWLWDNINSVWVKAQCDASGNLTVDLSGLPATFPLPAAQVTDLKAITSYPDPIISQTTPMNLRHVPHGYYAVGTSYLPYAVDSAGKLLLSIAALQHLSDIADVNLTGLADGDFIYYDSATATWKRIAHKDATTGVHGAGASTLATAATLATHAALVTGVHGFNISCKVYNSAAQACANGATVLLAFDSESWDTDTMHDTVTNNSRITCKTAGTYLIFMYLDFANNTTGCRRILPKYNGSVWLDDLTLPTSPSIAWRASHILFAVLAVNEYMEFYVYQDSGGSLNATANCRFGAARIA